MFEITRTIYSNSEMSVHFLKQNVFQLIPRVYSDLSANTLEHLKVKLDKNIDIKKLKRKV